MLEIKPIRAASICSSDRRMDIIDTHTLLDTPINKYKIKCDACEFPDIDSTPNPYFLAKGRDFSGIEIVEADLGNLLVSSRVKQIFEILFPDNCQFQKTYIQDSQIATKWWLAIPKTLIVSGEVFDYVKKCKVCNEPLAAHPGSQYKFRIQDFESSRDIIKSKNWCSIDELDWKKSWIGREIFLSVRLISLLRKISAKGIYQVMNSKYKSLTKDEKLWVEEALEKIGKLKEANVQKVITTKDISRLMGYLNIGSIVTSQVNNFEKKIKINAPELLKVLICAPANTKIKVADSEFTVLSYQNWEIIKEKKKLLQFADDDYGNNLLLDLKEKLLPIYFYDHETMIYELMYSSILDILN